MPRKKRFPLECQSPANKEPIGEQSAPVEPKKRKLTPQQRVFAKHFMAGKTRTEAARLAGYADNGYVGQIGSQVLENIKHKMPEIMDAHGLTEDVLIEEHLKPMLKAEETEFAKHEGKITDQINVTAWGPRSTALDMAFRLKGSYAPKESIGYSGGQITVNVLQVGEGSKRGAVAISEESES